MFDRIKDALKNKDRLMPAARARTQPEPRPQPTETEQPKSVAPPVVEPFTGTTMETATPLMRPADAIKGNIDHSGHIRLLAKSDAEAARLSLDAMTASRQRLTVMYGAANEVSAYMTGQGMLDVLTIAKNGDIVAAYPIFKAGAPWPARVTRVTECTDGFEGQLEIFADGTALDFFDALYFRNKGIYVPGSDARLLLAGIAYVMARSRGPAEDSLLVRYEGGDVDDYVFRGIATDVFEFTAIGRRAWAIRTSLRLGNESQPRDFYICATASALQEKISPGDRISGIIWLQGFLAP